MMVNELGRLGCLCGAVWVGAGLMPHPAMAADTVRNVSLSAGASSIELRGALRGRDGVRYRIAGQAGQVLEVTLKASNGGQAFNVMPRGAAEAMGRGTSDGAPAAWRLPGDGAYEIQTFLVRAAARRGERSTYTLAIRLGGAALPPLPSTADARVTGTPYHATASIPCRRPYAEADASCSAGVVRRGHDGTATVEIRDGQRVVRRLLFVQGALAAIDAATTSNGRREGDATRVEIDGSGERYLVPDAFLRGG